jgi:hypothetical protein
MSRNKKGEYVPKQKRGICPETKKGNIMFPRTVTPSDCACSTLNGDSWCRIHVRRRISTELVAKVFDRIVGRRHPNGISSENDPLARESDASVILPSYD